MGRGKKKKKQLTADTGTGMFIGNYKHFNFLVWVSELKKRWNYTTETQKTTIETKPSIKVPEKHSN